MTRYFWVSYHCENSNKVCDGHFAATVVDAISMKEWQLVALEAAKGVYPNELWERKMCQINSFTQIEERDYIQFEKEYLVAKEG